jgi:hypothetical protein
MVKREDANLFQNEIQVSVSFTAFMTAVTIFFVGLLITKFESFELSIKIPILFLIISTFAFLYSTLIFANASGQLSRHITKNFHKNMLIGDTLSEYLGVYLLVFAVPLVINVITTDSFLRLATLIAALGGLFIYHISGFSLMDRHFKRKHYWYLFLVIILEIALFYTQTYNLIYFIPLAVVLILFLLFLALFASRAKHLLK